jgi:hypothetical protein
MLSTAKRSGGSNGTCRSQDIVQISGESCTLKDKRKAEQTGTRASAKVAA